MRRYTVCIMGNVLTRFRDYSSDNLDTGWTTRMSRAKGRSFIVKQYRVTKQASTHLPIMGDVHNELWRLQLECTRHSNCHKNF